MKNKPQLSAGKLLMKLGKLRICIIDDEAGNFNPQMLQLASDAGFKHVERYHKIDKVLLSNLLKSPPDIIILDIKNVTTSDVAKDGFGVAKVLYEQTNTFIVITSAHKFHLHEYHKSYDYVMQQRLLTAVDFLDELNKIIEIYLSNKIRFYQKAVFRLGYAVAKKALIQSANS